MRPRRQQQRNCGHKPYTQELAEVDRAVLDSETDGFVKVHVREGSDKIVGRDDGRKSRRRDHLRADGPRLKPAWDSALLAM